MIHRERLPVVSVTSEIASSLSFQNAQRPAKSDAPANDSFGSLVDSNTAAADDNRADPASPRANDTPAPRRQDDPAPTTTRARDNSAADKPVKNDSADRDAAPAEQANAGADAKPDQARPAKSKSRNANTDETKSAAKADDVSAVDAAEGEPDQAAETKVDALATVITIAIVPAETPVAPPPAAGSTAPLAIAAAAIAATASLTGATAPSSATDTNAAGATVPAGGANTGEETPAAAQPTVAADAAVTTDAALTASVTAPVVAKAATPQTSATTGDTAPKAGEEQAGTTDTQAIPATTPAVPADAVQPTNTADKHGARHAAAEGLKADAAANGAAAAGTATHGQPASADPASTPVNAQATGLQTIATVQPQLQPAATQAGPQLTVTAASQAAVPLSGVAMEIAASVRSGKSSFEIRLDPAELGRIDVRIDVDRHGQVTSHLTVEKPETLQMLRQDANQLQRALNDAGLSTNGGGLQFSLRDQSQSGQNNQNQSNPHAQRLILSEEEAVPAAVANYGRMFGSNGGVDIRI
jgi:chemotaxis protein MotD